jgi:hypothetical protein
MQLALDLAPVVAVERTCGLCVHRNAPTAAERGFCTPAGWRSATDPPCEMWFGLEQLHADPYGRRKSA